MNVTSEKLGEMRRLFHDGICGKYHREKSHAPAFWQIVSHQVSPSHWQNLSLAIAILYIEEIFNGRHGSKAVGLWSHGKVHVFFCWSVYFSDGAKILKVEQGTIYSPGEIISRASYRYGESAYNVVWNNCEHFATWCRLGPAIWLPR